MSQIDYWLSRLESQLEGTRKLLAEILKERLDREVKLLLKP